VDSIVAKKNADVISNKVYYESNNFGWSFFSFLAFLKFSPPRVMSGSANLPWQCVRVKQ
jgi:hypothetical protein